MVNHHALDVLSTVVGWIYFFAWSFSFYPQVILNWRRKSVHGLSFDYQNYNILGFFSYSVYNVVLYWSPYLQDLYAEEYDGSTPDVALNDVVFALHALLLTSVTIIQCFIYESRGQVVSIPSMVLASLAWISLYIMSLLTVTGATKLDMFFLINYFSYVKAGVTAVKYIPQAYLNYARKSTVGWSIGNVLLDFTGGTFSLFQQIIDSINADDWTKLYGNPAKLALALLSLFFDTLFMVQHYILYREKSRKIEELESAGLVNPGTDLDEHSSPMAARREESEEDRSGYSFFGTRFGEKKKVVLGHSG